MRARALLPSLLSLGFVPGRSSASMPPAAGTITQGPPPVGVGHGDAGPTGCAPPPGESAGYDIGASLADLTVKDCAGNDYRLKTMCGASALWIFVADEWCLPCQHVAQEAETLYGTFAGKNVAAVNVVVQDIHGNPATAADCANWRDAFGLKNVMTLYDPMGVTNPLYDTGTTTLSVFVDKTWVIVDKVHTEDPTYLSNEINSALTH
jgi:hypothetical protein